jgi:hypothetical protein
MRIIKQIKEGFLPILDIMIPKGKYEKRIFGIFFFLFACFSVLFLHKYGNHCPHEEILDYDIDYWRACFWTIPTQPFQGGARHPLLMVIFFPLNCLVFGIRLLSGELFLHYYLIAFFFNAVTALSIMIIYKYCVNLIRISKVQALIVCLLFAFFAHILLLSFVAETFQLSMLGLLLVVYLTTDSFLNNKKIPIITNVILFVYVAGVTVSNGLKCVFAQLFQSGDFRYKRNSILLSGIITFVLILFSFFINSLVTEVNLTNARNSASGFTFAGQADIISEMFFEPVLFHQSHSFWGKCHEIFAYNTIFPVIVNLILYAVIICAVLVNIRKKAVLLLLSFFGADVLIHLICGFGIDTLQVYSLHWLFIFPLLIGWLYKEINNSKMKTGLNVLILLLSISLAVNNIPRIIELIY